MSDPYTVEHLAEFAVTFPLSDIPESAIHAAKRCVLDVLGAAAVGLGTDSARAWRRVMMRRYREGEASLWYAPERLDVPGAAVANSGAASALDVDDGHRDAAGHPGSAVIPAALAVAEQLRVSGREFLGAVVVGYEIGVRIAAARDFSTLDTLSTGRWAAYGVAAAAVRLLRMAPARAAQALAVAGVLSPGLSAAGYSALMGNSVKEGIPWAVLTGLTAVDLAREGFTGPTDILDHPNYHDATRIRASLGEMFAIERTYFKPYSCCRWVHSALDGLSGLMKSRNLSARDIQSVDVHTFSRALKLNNDTNPSSLESAQYSIPFCLAVAAVCGKEALLPLKPSVLRDPLITEWAKRVHLYRDEALDGLFPARTAARIRVVTKDGAFEKTVLDPLGDPLNPMSDAVLEDKFRHLGGHVLAPEEQDRLVALVRSLEHLPAVHPITDMLSRASSPPPPAACDSTPYGFADRRNRASETPNAQ